MENILFSILENINESFILIDENKKVITKNSKSNEVFKKVENDDILNLSLFFEDDENEAKRLLEEIDNFTEEQDYIYNFNKRYFVVKYKKILNNYILILFEKFDDNYFKKVLDSSNANIVLVDPNIDGMPCIYANNAFFESTGFIKEEVLGKNLALLKVDDSDKEQREELKNALANAEPIRTVLKNQRKNGQIFYNKVSISPLVNKYTNRLQLFTGVQNDITDEMNEKFVLETIFNTIFSLILVIENGKLINANQKFLETFGFNSLEDFNNNYDSFCKMFLDSEDENALKPLMNGQRWSHYVAKNDDKIHKLYLKAADGSVKIYRVQCTLSQMLNREIITLNNITEIEDSNILLQKQSKFAAMGEMISMIAHQWRQPLITLKAVIDKVNVMQKLGTLTREKYIENHSKMSDLILHMSQTIEDFRTYFDTQDNKADITLDELVSKSVKLNEPILKNCNIKYEYFSNGLGHKVVCLNSSKFMQVLLNLFKNSIDEFINKACEIKKITIELAETEKEYAILFEDTAGGIPDEFIEKIFDPYFSTKSKNGTGLGLYMSKIIVQEHIGGELYVENRGFGAQFVIKIPKEFKK